MKIILKGGEENEKDIGLVNSANFNTILNFNCSIGFKPISILNR